jgi:prophage maintenance system killer protein
MSIPQNSQIITTIFEGEDFGVKVKVDNSQNTIWLTQGQIAELFDKDRSVINRHINNVLNDKELSEGEVSANFAHTTKHGSIKGKTQTKDVKYYNLDMIISVGYRVNSSRATQFRQWATKVLNKYLTDGYLFNITLLKKREKQLMEIQQTLDVLVKNAKHLSSPDLFVSLLEKYSQSLEVLNRYDEGRLTLKNNKQSIQIEVSEFRDLIAKTKQDLISKKEASEIFGKDLDSKFEGLVGNIYQTFDGRDLYPSLEEKAANLFYLIIKDHPFVDGNKRIASIILVYYLAKNHFLQDSNGSDKINQTGLVALALLIAQSNPNDKEILIKLITNFITDY